MLGDGAAPLAHSLARPALIHGVMRPSSDGPWRASVMRCKPPRRGWVGLDGGAGRRA